MQYRVYSPGTCGEFIQGEINKKPVLISCPINRFSTAIFQPISKLTPLQTKSYLAYNLVKNMSSFKSRSKPILYSNLPPEKGMGSSTADVTAIALATALEYKVNLNSLALAQLATTIEPTNSSFFFRPTLFNYIDGYPYFEFSKLPKFNIVIFDNGGHINTIDFNKKYSSTNKIFDIEKALHLFNVGVNNKSLAAIGKASILSALAHQSHLFKPKLDEFLEISKYYESSGVVIAHSGTIMGAIFPPNYYKINKFIKAINDIIPNLAFIDIAESYSEGIKYEKI